MVPRHALGPTEQLRSAGTAVRPPADRVEGAPGGSAHCCQLLSIVQAKYSSAAISHVDHGMACSVAGRAAVGDGMPPKSPGGRLEALEVLRGGLQTNGPKHTITHPERRRTRFQP